MTFEEADKLMWEILKFLWTCPTKGKVHPYRLVRIRSIQENVIEALKTGQYILFRDEAGAILHFLCYWRVRAEDIETVCEGIKPAVRWEGDKIYICEHGNKGGKRSLTEMIKEIRRRAGGDTEGVFWHNWNRQHYSVFLGQKGV